MTDIEATAAAMVQPASEAQQSLGTFWPKATEEIRQMTLNDLKTQELPLARIKKIMKLDDAVKMISAEAPVLFAKAAEIFITELSLRAWVHTEDNKRRTLQRNDIAMAITKYDQFDFLIDIVPRDELKPAKARDESSVRTASMLPDQVQYYFHIAQQHQSALQQAQTQPQTMGAGSAGTTVATVPAQSAPSVQPQTVQIVQPGGQIQTVPMASSSGTAATPTTVQVHSAEQQSQPVPQPTTQVHVQATQSQPAQPVQVQSPQQVSPQIIQLQPTQVLSHMQQQTPQQGGIQIVQQIVGPSGEIQQIPIQLTSAQLQMIRLQMQGSTNQSIIIQTAPIQAVQQAPVVTSQAQPQVIQVGGPQGSGPASVILTPTVTAAAGHEGGQEG